MFNDLLKRVLSAGNIVLSALAAKRTPARIDSLDKLQSFVATRAAFITQKKLYGYLKTRMGTRWPKMFEDELFKDSISLAAVNIFTAALSDLTIHAVASALKDARLDDQHKAVIARRFYEKGLADNETAPAADQFDTSQALRQFDKRLEGTDWNFGALRAENFTRSPAALLRWAPIADELKQFDAEIVENSMKFAWIEIRRDLHARLVKDAIAAEARASIRT